jgi:hypothetical protein
MAKFVFISCGQGAEARLGKDIAGLVKEITGLESFFAENVQELNSLYSNILEALHACVAVVAVLHPRGTVQPSGLTRASVWVEQEIAIAAYIRTFEKADLPIIAFKHDSVCLEGIRSLIHLNPTPFQNDNEILPVLRERLKEWSSLRSKANEIELQLKSLPLPKMDEHLLRTLQVFVANHTNNPLSTYSLQLCLPAKVLEHRSAIFPAEELPRSSDGIRRFRFSEREFGIVAPSQTKPLCTYEYCLTCGGNSPDWAAHLVLLDKPITATLWTNGKKYVVEKTIKKLSMENPAR